MVEFRALRDLMVLYEERATDLEPSQSAVAPVQSNPPPLLRLKSLHFPNLFSNPNIWAFLHQTVKGIKQLIIHSFPSVTCLTVEPKIMRLSSCAIPLVVEKGTARAVDRHRDQEAGVVN